MSLGNGTGITPATKAVTGDDATSGVRSTMRRRFAVLAAALTGAGMDAVLLTWARPAAPTLPLAATLAVVLLLGRRRPAPNGGGRRPPRGRRPLT